MKKNQKYILAAASILTLGLHIHIPASFAQKTTVLQDYNCKSLIPQNYSSLTKEQEIYAQTLLDLCDKTKKIGSQDYQVVVDLFDKSQNWFKGENEALSSLKNEFSQTLEVNNQILKFEDLDSNLIKKLNKSNVQEDKKHILALLVYKASTLEENDLKTFNEAFLEHNLLPKLDRVFNEAVSSTTQGQYSTNIATQKKPKPNDVLGSTMSPTLTEQLFSVSGFLDTFKNNLTTLFLCFFILLLAAWNFIQKNKVDEIQNKLNELNKTINLLGKSQSKTLSYNEVLQDVQLFQSSPNSRSSSTKKTRLENAIQNLVEQEVSSFQRQLDLLKNQVTNADKGLNTTSSTHPYYIQNNIYQEKSQETVLADVIKVYLRNPKIPPQYEGVLKLRSDEKNQMDRRAGKANLLLVETNSMKQYYAIPTGQDNEYIIIPDASQKFDSVLVKLTGFDELYDYHAENTFKVQEIPQPALMLRESATSWSLIKRGEIITA